MRKANKVEVPGETKVIARNVLDRGRLPLKNADDLNTAWHESDNRMKNLFGWSQAAAAVARDLNGNDLDMKEEFEALSYKITGWSHGIAATLGEDPSKN